MKHKNNRVNEIIAQRFITKSTANTLIRNPECREQSLKCFHTGLVSEKASITISDGNTHGFCPTIS